MEGRAQTGDVAGPDGREALVALNEIRGRMFALRQVCSTDVIGVELGRAYAIVDRLLVELGDASAAGGARQ